MTDGGYTLAQARAMHAGDVKQPVGVVPARLQLSRRKGASILLESLARNGLDVVVVARPSLWGNPFSAANAFEMGYLKSGQPPGPLLAQTFREWLTKRPGVDWWMGPKSEAKRDWMLTNLHQLRGKNLACWCALDQPCHADVLLELASRGAA